MVNYYFPCNETEAERYVSRVEDFQEDIVKFAFTEYYFIQHISEVVRDMRHFIKTGKCSVFTRRNKFMNNYYDLD